MMKFQMKLQGYSSAAALGMFAFAALACSSAVHAADLLTVSSSTLSASDPTQLGRLSRSGTPSDWSVAKAFPGTLNASTSYHYRTYTVSPGTANFIQVEVLDNSGAFFVSAYKDAYDPTNEATNYLGDNGFSGPFIGGERTFFEVVAPAGHNVVIVIDEVATNGGVGPLFGLQVEGFTDVAYSNPLTVGDFSLTVTPPSQSLPAGGGTTPSYVMTVNNLNGFTGGVHCSLGALPTGITSSGLSVKNLCNGASFTLTAAASVAAGNYPINVTGISGPLTHTVQATLVVGSVTPTFILSANPSTLTLLPAATTNNTSTVTVQSQNGFNSAVALTISGCPINSTCVITASVTPPPNGSAPAALTISPSQTTLAGTYTVTISGNAGAAATTVQVIIQDFAFAPPPTPVSVNLGSTATSQVSMQSQNLFSQTVTVTVSGCPASTTCLFLNGQATTTMTPAPGATLMVPLNIVTTPATPIGLTTLTITGQIGTDIHTAFLPVSVIQAPDFSISSNPASITFSKTALQGTSTITLTSLNGFTGIVSLGIAGCPVACTLPGPVPLSSGGTATPTLTLFSSAKSPPVSGTLTIFATNGAVIHQLQIPYSITQ